MPTPPTLLWLMLAVPAATGLLCAALRSPRLVLGALLAGVGLAVAVGARTLAAVWTQGPLEAAGGWLCVDALSAYNLAIMLGVYALSSAYAWVYFTDELRRGTLSLRQARLFAGLWCGAMSAMTLVFVAHNLGVMWVGIEATTLLTAFLICVHVSRESLEAMWKYILICSVGVAFAFMGTLLAAASARGVDLSTHTALFWTNLRDHAGQLDPTLMKAAFIFLLVGYGTKAGLAPMHSWLPDAHSQAPAPVSALFSGLMLNTALYCILRYVPIVEGATGHSGWSLHLLAGLGLLSVLLAGGFILFQRDLKRFLAYSSVEHMGVIALGVGLGGFGVFAALFHMLNHSLGKTLAFFAAGRLGQRHGTHEMKRISGALRDAPVWGAALLGSVLALIGMAPFAVFMSEFQILKAAVDGGAWVSLALFLVGAGVVFIGALSHLMALVWGAPATPGAPARATVLEVVLTAAPLALLLALGLWMPSGLQTALARAAEVIQSAGPPVAGLAAGGAP